MVQSINLGVSSSGHPSKFGPEAALSWSMQHPNSVNSQESHIHIYRRKGQNGWKIRLKRVQERPKGVKMCVVTNLWGTFKASLLLGTLSPCSFIRAASKGTIFTKFVFITAFTIRTRSWSFSVRTATEPNQSNGCWDVEYSDPNQNSPFPKLHILKVFNSWNLYKNSTYFWQFLRRLFRFEWLFSVLVT